MLNVKNINIIITKITQVLFIYKYINEKLRRDLLYLKNNFTIANLLKELRY